MENIALEASYCSMKYLVIVAIAICVPINFRVRKSLPEFPKPMLVLKQNLIVLAVILLISCSGQGMW